MRSLILDPIFCREHYQEDEGKRNGEGEGRRKGKRRMGTGKRMVVCTGCISSDAP